MTDHLTPEPQEVETRTVIVSITRVQTTTMELPIDQPLTGAALDDADWDHIWEHEEADTTTATVVVEVAP